MVHNSKIKVFGIKQLLMSSSARGAHSKQNKMPSSNSNYFQEYFYKAKIVFIVLSEEMVQVSIYEHSEICSQETIKLQ